MAAQEELSRSNTQLDDEDACSEFSVISMSDDREPIEERPGAKSPLPEMDEVSAERVVYIQPSDTSVSDVLESSTSMHSAIEMPENIDNESCAHSTTSAWNPLAISGYVSTAAVTDVVESMFREYKQSHEMLATINESIVDLKAAKCIDVSKTRETEDKLAELQESFKIALARIVDLENEKSVMTHKLEAANNDVEMLKKLDSHLDKLCRDNKELRETLDETIDQVRAAQMEIEMHKGDIETKNVIIEALKENDTAASSHIAQLNKNYMQHIKSLEDELNAHDRNEVVIS